MDFQPGEIVNVTIKGVRYIDHDAQGACIETGDRDRYLLPSSAVIERVAPKEWPPQPGDVWTDRDGDEWLGTVEDTETTIGVRTLIESKTGRRTAPGYVAKEYGPLTLVRRRGWTPEAPAADEPASRSRADRRAQLVADLRTAADWIEQHTELPVTSWRDLSDRSVSYCAGSLAELERVAALIDTSITTDSAGHMHANAEIDGVRYRAFHVPPEPAEDSEATP